MGYRRILQVFRLAEGGHRYDNYYIFRLERGKWSPSAIKALRAHWEAKGFKTLVTVAWFESSSSQAEPFVSSAKG